MKLKYYLRGLGMGIIVTALILMIFYNVKGKMSDKEIISRAEKLGMIMKETENDTLFWEQTSELESASEDGEIEKGTDADTTEAVTEQESEFLTEEPTEEPSETEAEETTEISTEAQTEASEETTAEETGSANPSVYTLTITSGMYSEAVSARLAEAGMVASAVDFNSYLERNGYAERIRTGVYNITSGMSYDDIAGMIIQ